MFIRLFNVKILFLAFLLDWTRAMDVNEALPAAIWNGTAVIENNHPDTRNLTNPSNETADSLVRDERAIKHEFQIEEDCVDTPKVITKIMYPSENCDENDYNYPMGDHHGLNSRLGLSNFFPSRPNLDDDDYNEYLRGLSDLTDTDDWSNEKQKIPSRSRYSKKGSARKGSTQVGSTRKSPSGKKFSGKRRKYEDSSEEGEDGSHYNRKSKNRKASRNRNRKPGQKEGRRRPEDRWRSSPQDLDSEEEAYPPRRKAGKKTSHSNRKAGVSKKPGYVGKGRLLNEDSSERDDEMVSSRRIQKKKKNSSDRGKEGRNKSGSRRRPSDKELKADENEEAYRRSGFSDFERRKVGQAKGVSSRQKGSDKDLSSRRKNEGVKSKERFEQNIQEFDMKESQQGFANEFSARGRQHLEGRRNPNGKSVNQMEGMESRRFQNDTSKAKTRSDRKRGKSSSKGEKQHLDQQLDPFAAYSTASSSISSSASASASVGRTKSKKPQYDRMGGRDGYGVGIYLGADINPHLDSKGRSDRSSASPDSLLGKQYPPQGGSHLKSGREDVFGVPVNDELTSAECSKSRESSIERNLAFDRNSLRVNYKALQLGYKENTRPSSEENERDAEDAAVRVALDFLRMPLNVDVLNKKPLNDSEIQPSNNFEQVAHPVYQLPPPEKRPIDCTKHFEPICAELGLEKPIQKQNPIKRIKKRTHEGPLKEVFNASGPRRQSTTDFCKECFRKATMPNWNIPTRDELKEPSPEFCKACFEKRNFLASLLPYHNKGLRSFERIKSEVPSSHTVHVKTIVYKDDEDAEASKPLKAKEPPSFISARLQKVPFKRSQLHKEYEDDYTTFGITNANGQTQSSTSADGKQNKMGFIGFTYDPATNLFTPTNDSGDNLNPDIDTSCDEVAKPDNEKPEAELLT